MFSSRTLTVFKAKALALAITMRLLVGGTTVVLAALLSLSMGYPPVIQRIDRISDSQPHVRCGPGG